MSLATSPLEPAVSLDGLPSLPTIVVGVDGSAASIAALRWATDLAHRTDHRVRALHVRQLNALTITGFDSIAVLPTDTDPYELLEQCLAEAVPDPGERAAVERVVRTGPVIDLMLDECRDAAVLVIGQRASVFGQRFSGTARRVVAHAACPVVVVPPQAAWPGRRGRGSRREQRARVR